MGLSLLPMEQSPRAPALMDRMAQAMIDFDHDQAYSPTPSELYSPFCDHPVCICTRRDLVILGVFILLIIGALILCLLLTVLS